MTTALKHLWTGVTFDFHEVINSNEHVNSEWALGLQHILLILRTGVQHSAKVQIAAQP